MSVKWLMTSTSGAPVLPGYRGHGGEHGELSLLSGLAMVNC